MGAQTGRLFGTLAFDADDGAQGGGDQQPEQNLPNHCNHRAYLRYIGVFP